MELLAPLAIIRRELRADRGPPQRALEHRHRGRVRAVGAPDGRVVVVVVRGPQGRVALGEDGEGGAEVAGIAVGRAGRDVVFLQGIEADVGAAGDGARQVLEDLLVDGAVGGGDGGRRGLRERV